MYKLETLNNKIKLITAPLTETQAVTVLILVKVGSRYESIKLNGISHFIEHLMFKGTKKRPTSLHISKELDGIGADYNAFTSKQHTGYYIKAGKEHLELMVEMLADIVFNSTFDAKEIERERGVIIEEINMYEDNPLMHIGDVFEETIFKGHELGNNISGPKENIKRLTRNDIVKFYRDHYHNGNLIIGLAGNFKQQTAKKLIDKYFTKRKSHTEPSSFNKYALKQKSPQVGIFKKDTKQIQVAMGFPTFENTNAKKYALTLLGVILGGGMSSRLFTEIREKRGLCYFIRASTNLYEDTGDFAIHAGLDKARLEEALKTIKQELIKVKTKGVTVAELKQAKEFIKGKLILQLEDSASLIGWLTEQELLTGKIENLKAKIKKIQNVSLSEVNKVASEIINFKKSNLALIGPFKDKEKFLKILSS